MTFTLFSWLFFGPPNLPVCQNNLDFCIRLFGDRGIPLHPDNLEGPSTCLTVLGIELDSLALQARLPRNKFECIIALLDTWSSKQYCMRKVLEDHRQSPTRLKIHFSGAYLFTAYDQLIISVPARWPIDKAYSKIPFRSFVDSILSVAERIS